jgi:hypothetical protein
LKKFVVYTENYSEYELQKAKKEGQTFTGGFSCHLLRYSDFKSFTRKKDQLKMMNLLYIYQTMLRKALCLQTSKLLIVFHLFSFRKYGYHE